MSNATFVYIIGAQDGPVKVGITTSLLSRLRSLQTGSSHKLELLYVYTALTRADAVKMEQWFHEVHAENRLEGEWFDLSAELAIEGLADQIDLSSTFARYHFAAV